MNSLVMTNGREPAGWNAEPVQRFTSAAHPIDLLDEEAIVHRPTPTLHSIDSFDASEEVGRYRLPSDGAVPVPEVGDYLPLLDAGFATRLYDPALDEFFPGARFGDFHGHGPFGAGSSELRMIDGASDDVVVSPATDAEDLADAFIMLPHGEAFALPLNEGIEAFGGLGGDATFGGGDDPLWMLTLLPSPDDYIHDTGFGHSGPGFDPWG